LELKVLDPTLPATMMLHIITATAVAVAAFVLGWQMGLKKSQATKVDQKKTAKSLEPPKR
jgi:hypothetical protein